MTRTNFWRLSLAAILGFGWLFLAPAHSNDPLELAQKQIQQLEADLENLSDKTKTQELIDIAKSKYDLAVLSKSSLQDAQIQYDLAEQNKSTALINKNQSQLLVNEQQQIVDSANQVKNDSYDAYNSAQTSLNAHIITYGVSGSDGVSFQIFPLSRMGNYAYIAEGSGVWCQVTIPNFNAYAGWGGICGLSQNIIGIFRSTVTFPNDIDTVRFAGNTDDGFRLYVDGVLATEQWQEQGAAWSPYTKWYDVSEDKTLELEAWWYNGGGPGSMHVAYMTPQYLTGIPSEWLSWGSQLSPEILNERQELQEDLNLKFIQYQTALSLYNDENNKLIQYNQNLTTDIQNLTIAEQNLTTSFENLTAAQYNYEVAILKMQNSIINARNEYEKQLKFEEAQRVAAAIAQALANQPSPEPTPEPEPSPLPSPEPSPTIPPTEEPSPEPTPEPSPEQSPKPEPSPSEDEASPSPEPSPEPSPSPSQEETIKPVPNPSPKPPKENVIDNGTTEDLSNVIANLTSKNNVTVKLTAEQMAAVGNTLLSLSNDAKVEVADSLGIKSEEIQLIAEAAKSNPVIATAIVEFSNRAEENADAAMPYTLADATTEIATEQFLSDPIGALINIDFEKVFSPSEWGKDMTDDQREKAQEVIVPVIIASNIVAAAMTRRI